MGNAQTSLESSPLSHVIPVTDVSSQGRDVSISATDQELSDIANALSLVSAQSLSAHFTISKGAGSLLAVQGHLTADVVQTCGVSLEPVQEHIDADITLSFTLDPETESSEIAVDVNDDDPPDPVVDGHIDFGSVVLEHLALNLNPYPRAPNVRFDQESLEMGGSGADSAVSGPFSALAKLQRTEN